MEHKEYKQLHAERYELCSDATENNRDEGFTLHVVTSDGACFEAMLDAVKKADGVQFKARAP